MAAVHPCDYDDWGDTPVYAAMREHQRRRAVSRDESNPNVTFQRNMHIHRKQQSVTAKDLADRIGKSRTMVTMIETGKSNLTLDTAVAIADALGVSLSEMVFEQVDCTHSEIHLEKEGYRCHYCGAVVSVSVTENGERPQGEPQDR